ncbi:hypothetical protein HYT53_05130 [Candidatus Woesearchaeota archaeon]|nr:hypothetical protein [Candidatus Woesearchaeota archaeon]
MFSDKQQNIPFDVQINLFELAYQMHLSKPMSKISSSRRTKFNDYLPYIKRITNGIYLSFEISDMDSEQKGQAAEIIGEGLSRCLVSSLFNVQENSMNKLKGPWKRADFEAMTSNEESIVCESKGSFDNIPQSEVNRARTQKNSRNADIRIAAINEIGVLSRLIDPSSSDNRNFDRFSKLIIKTNHYIQIFKLAGQQELTRYFKLMKKRFQNKNMTDFPEFSEKQGLWFKLKYESQRQKINGKEFIGKVELIENNRIIFIGFDEKLLNVDTFELFKDYEKVYVNQNDNITTFISKDGVCFIEADLRALRVLFPEIRQDEIKNYQESTWLTDIDNMNEIVFSNYLQFIFKENNIEFQKEKKIRDRIADYTINYEGIIYHLELKLFRKKTQLIYKKDKDKLSEDIYQTKLIEETLKEKIRFLPDVDVKSQILITNKDKRLVHAPKDMIIFDRNELKKLLRDKYYFVKFLSKFK